MRYQVLNKPYNFYEVLEGIDSCLPAIELPDSRFKYYSLLGANNLISDNACAGEYIFNNNAEISLKNIDFPNFKVHCYKNNSLVSVGLGKNVLNNPLEALKWIINELNFLEIAVFKNQVILTGTCIKPFLVNKRDTILFDFHELGKVTCSFD